MKASIFCLLFLLACGGKSTDTATSTPIPPPGPLQVGVAKVTMPLPLGIGTTGFLGATVPDEPSPFNVGLASTTRQWGQHDFRAVVISRGGPHEVIFLRTDTIGVMQAQRAVLLKELKQRTGRDLDDNLLISATHTHAGPGRIVPAEGGVLALGFGTFDPEYFERFIDAMADAVELAYADLQPGRVGHAITDVGDAIEDRRCEDGAVGAEAADATTPIIAIEQSGELRAIVTTMAFHGTLLGVGELTLSPDVSGPIETAIEDRFPGVQVQLHNSWGADHRPSNPVDIPSQDGSTLPGNYDQGEQVGQRVADAVVEGMVGMTYNDSPEVWSEIHRVPLSRDAIGYGDDEFKYDFGGVYCGPSDSDCDLSTDFYPTFDDGCLPLPEEYLELGTGQTLFAVGRIGDLHLVSWPGEAAAEVKQKVVDQIRTEHGVGDVLFLGYAQDYTGYSLLEDNYWQGGYEASGAMWGPKQGAYLSDRLIEAFGHYKNQTRASDEMPQIGMPAVVEQSYTPYDPPEAVGLGEVLTDVLPTYTAADIVVFSVKSNDPWLGTPIAYLEQSDGTPVLRPSGDPVSSRDFAFWVDLTVEPPYADGLDLASREYQWHFSMPITHKTVNATPAVNGDYRIRVVGHTEAGDEVETISAAFAVTL